MELIPNIREQLLSLSNELERSPAYLQNVLVLGFQVGQSCSSGQRENLLMELGFTQKDGLWEKRDEVYDSCMQVSSLGYLSFGEIDDWRLSIIKQCKNKNIALCLPVAMDLASANSHAVSQLLINLFADACDSPILFSRNQSAKEQAALYVALGLLSWPQTWRLLFEEMRIQQQLSAANIDKTIDIIFDEHSMDEVLEIGNTLSVRMQCENNSESLSKPGNADLLREKLRQSLIRFA